MEGKLDAIEDSAVSMNEAASMLSSAEDGISELTAADLIKDDEDRTESFADNLNDCHGVISTLYQDIAEELLTGPGADGVFFNTDVEVGKLGKSIDEWL